MPDTGLIELICVENQRFGPEPGLGPALNRPSILFRARVIASSSAWRPT